MECDNIKYQIQALTDNELDEQQIDEHRGDIGE